MNSYQNFDLDLRHFIYRIFALTAHPPTSQTMAEHFNCSLTKVEVSLTRLAEAHQIALAPGTYSVWMAHPFSSIPTNYIAKVDTKEYWGNWIWDIFGIAVILGKDVKVRTPCGCGECAESLKVKANLGQAIHSDWFVHFLVPAKGFWDDIGYTWATILPFSSKDHLQKWLTSKGLKIGYYMPIEKCWQLAQAWYPGRAERNWQRPNAKEVFDSLGLTDSFWQIG